ncbi:MAG: TrkA family potassium uptake protein [Desulfosarcina sp.]|nr:TrkA family potassium uptake protein [Desulfobacterales bacterium]
MKKFAIIGLGKFGHYLATGLYEKGHEVLALDKNSGSIQAIKDLVSQAVVADATDRHVLELLGIQEMDSVVVCIGSVLSDSILAVFNLKDIGVKNIFAKSISEAHKRILYKVGATEVFFPEKDTAVSLAEKMRNPNMLDYLPFLEGYSIIELAVPNKFIGKSLQELNLINKFGILVIAIKEIVPERLNLIPKGNFILKDSDSMILLGTNEAFEKLKKTGQ